MLEAIFYARFHLERGPSVVHQYPHDAVAHSNTDPALLSFGDVRAYVIPPYGLCNRPFSIVSRGHQVLGFPVSLEDPKYDRNRFTFNVCFVLAEKEDPEPWLQIVAKTAAFFSSIEEEDGLLRAEEHLAGLKWAGEESYPASEVGVVYNLLKTVFTDLNAYQETCTRLADTHVLNLRLDLSRPPAPKVHGWDVPLLIRSLPSEHDWTYDPTLERMLPHIDGVRCVKHISEVADVELKLVKRAVGELVHHHRVILLDLFNFAAIYAPTADLEWLINDEEMLDECCNYVRTDATISIPTHNQLVSLYTAFMPGLPLQDFVLSHQAELRNIDIRRLMTYGVIKGFLRRIQKYALATPTSTQLLSPADPRTSPTKSKPKSNEDAVREFERAWKRAALTSGWATPPQQPPPVMRTTEAAEDDKKGKLAAMLDGKHCFDQICLAMGMRQGKVTDRLKGAGFGDVVLFNK